MKLVKSTSHMNNSIIHFYEIALYILEICGFGLYYLYVVKFLFVFGLYAVFVSLTIFIVFSIIFFLIFSKFMSGDQLLLWFSINF